MLFLFFIAFHDGLDVPSIHHLNLKIQNDATEKLKANFDIERRNYFAIFLSRCRYVLHFLFSSRL